MMFNKWLIELSLCWFLLNRNDFQIVKHSNDNNHPFVSKKDINLVNSFWCSGSFVYEFQILNTFLGIRSLGTVLLFLQAQGILNLLWFMFLLLAVNMLFQMVGLIFLRLYKRDNIFCNLWVLGGRWTLGELAFIFVAILPRIRVTITPNQLQTFHQKTEGYKTSIPLKSEHEKLLKLRCSNIPHLKKKLHNQQRCWLTASR